ncbi:hypothetical protein FBR05_00725 [Deltaproteobacteria bacterium PRO3]|nr:hypothetical protein [Deltaproteobacteria bacterium PRO3]
MKLRKFLQSALGVGVFLSVAATGNLSAQSWVIVPVFLESVTKVQQQHNPVYGANSLTLSIEGRSAGKPMNVNISVNSPGWGAQKMFDSCEKHAMLALHYPGRYVFEVVSGDGGQDGSITLNVSDGNSDAVICSVKAKTQVMDPQIPSTSIMKTPNISN